MAIIVKNIIYDIDNVNSYFHFEADFPAPQEFAGTDADVLSKINTPLLGKEIIGCLINGNKLNKIINSGPYSIYYLNIGADLRLDEIDVTPRDAIIDIHAVKGNANRLIYTFYNGNTDAPTLLIRYSVCVDEGLLFQKVLQQQNDPIFRAAIVKQLMKRQQGSVSKLTSCREIMNAEEVADYLGLATKTIRNWTSSKRIQSHKIGGAIRYKRSEIELLLDNKKSLRKASKKTPTRARYVP